LRRIEQKQATAERVLGAARDEFEARGFEGASIRGIAEQAGVSVGTVMHHYGDKRQLLYAALHSALEGGIARSVRQTREGPLLTQLERFAAGVFRVYEKRPMLSRTLLKESLFADGEWGERFVAQHAAAHAAVRRLCVAAVERGELSPSTDLDALGLAFLSFFNFALLAWVQGARGPEGPRGLFNRLLRSHLELHLVDQARERPKASRTRVPERPSSSPRTRRGAR
jgi:AcrR family transcriptional regulator